MCFEMKMKKCGWSPSISTKLHLNKLQKISQHIVVLQRLQLPDGHGANLGVRVVTVEQLHGQTNIQTTAGEQHKPPVMGVCTDWGHKHKHGGSLKNPCTCCPKHCCAPTDGESPTRPPASPTWLSPAAWGTPWGQGQIIFQIRNQVIPGRKTLWSQMSTWGRACTRAWSARAALCPQGWADAGGRSTQWPQTASSGGSASPFDPAPPTRRPRPQGPRPGWRPGSRPGPWAAPQGSSTCPARWRRPWRRPCPGWLPRWACPRWCCCCCCPRSSLAPSTCGGWTRPGGAASGGRWGAGSRSTGDDSWSLLKDGQRHSDKSHELWTISMRACFTRGNLTIMAASSSSSSSSCIVLVRVSLGVRCQRLFPTNHLDEKKNVEQDHCTAEDRNINDSTHSSISITSQHKDTPFYSGSKHQLWIRCLTWRLRRAPLGRSLILMLNSSQQFHSTSSLKVLEDVLSWKNKFRVKLSAVQTQLGMGFKEVQYKNNTVSASWNR